MASIELYFRIENYPQIDGFEILDTDFEEINDLSYYKYQIKKFNVVEKKELPKLQRLYTLFHKMSFFRIYKNEKSW